MYKIKDVGIGGGMQINKEMQAMHVPQHWNSYVMVKDINESVKAAKSLGGTILKDVSDVMEMGKMAVIADPTGGVFSLWQVLRQDQGTSLPDQTPGNIGWHELITNDTDKAAKFYTSLFKWTLETKKIPSGEIYTLFKNADKYAGGMMKPCETDTMGSRWGIYFNVTNLDEFIEKAKKLGGTICYDPITAEDVGRFTMIRDPEGIFFSVIQPTSP